MEEAGLERDWKLGAWEDGLLGADADIVAVSFHSRTRSRWHCAQPRCGGKEPGSRGGRCSAPREGEVSRFPLGCVPALGQGGDGPSQPPALVCSGRPPLLALVVPKAQEQGGKPEMRRSQKKLELSTKHQCLLPWVRAEPGK